MTALILPKLGACRTAKEAVEKLEAMGARPCGSGFYSRVYRVEVREEIDRAPMSYMDFRAVANLKPWEMMQPIRPSFATERRVRVIKVALTRDPGGLMAANAAMLTKDYDDLAPRYYGVTEFGDGTWMGELEELVPVASYYDNVDYCGHSDKTRHLTAGTREPVGELFETSVYLRTLRDMRSSYTRKNPSKSCNWDIHGDNVMMRGAQPVITDPLSAS